MMIHRLKSIFTHFLTQINHDKPTFLAIFHPQNHPKKITPNEARPQFPHLGDAGVTQREGETHGVRHGGVSLRAGVTFICLWHRHMNLM